MLRRHGVRIERSLTDVSVSSHSGARPNVTAELQTLVEDLAETLGHPVSIDDRRFRLLAYSPLTGQNDPVAAASILHRRSPPEVVKWLRSIGVQHATGWTRVPAHPALDMVARVCAPIRWEDVLLGYVWVIDVVPLDAAEVDLVVVAADRASVSLYRERLASREAQARAEDLLALLLFHKDEARRAEAASELEALSVLTASPGIGVAVVEVWHQEHDRTTEAVSVRVQNAVAQLRHPQLAAPAVAVAREDQVVVVFPCRGEPAVTEIGQLLETAVADALAAEPGWCTAIGVGTPRRRLGAASDAYVEADSAIRLARALPANGTTVHWSAMGAYRTILGLGERSRLRLPDAFRLLLDSPEAGILVETLEAYLELAGNPGATAQELHLHRSTLYQRLRKIETVAGVDLRSGDTRLELHLGVRLWRLEGSPLAGGLGGPLKVAGDSRDVARVA